MKYCNLNSQPVNEGVKKLVIASCESQLNRHLQDLCPMIGIDSATESSSHVSVTAIGCPYLVHQARSLRLCRSLLSILQFMSSNEIRFLFPATLGTSKS